MNARIIDRGRGPEITETRITVYDVVDYLEEGWHSDQIAGLFRLPLEDVEAALHYIEEHKEAVMATYRQIVSRHSDVRYLPEVEAKLAQNRQKLQHRLAEIRARQQTEDVHAGNHGGS
jgi:uncharacterized protein (DUF433 family)